jgi:uncharacterized membrane protein YccC
MPTLKLANPLHYPIAVAAGAVVLVAGIRLANLSPVLALPLAVAIGVGGATLQKTQAAEATLENPALERELRSTKQQARELADKANTLRQESSRLLTDSAQMELLVAVQSACDRAAELPARVEQLSRRMQGADSLLEVSDLQQQLTEAETRLRSSTGVAHEQLARLVDSLRRNIRLAQQGQDARQAQVVSLSTLILDSAGVLQSMQNQLRSANLSDTRRSEELRSLSDELSGFQENIALLVSK